MTRRFFYKLPFIFIPALACLGSSASYAEEPSDNTKRIVTLASSPVLLSIEDLAGHTVEYSMAPELVSEVATNYAVLLEKVTGRPQSEITSQLMGAISRRGVTEGLLAPMLGTYDQVSFLGGEAADLISPLITQLNPQIGDLLNERFGSMVQIPSDYEAFFEAKGSVFSKLKTPLGDIAKAGNGGKTFLSGVRPTEPFERSADPDRNPNGGRPAGEGTPADNKGPSTDQIIRRTFVAAVGGFVGGYGVASARPGLPNQIKVTIGILGAAYEVSRTLMEIEDEKKGVPTPPPLPDDDQSPSSPSPPVSPDDEGAPSGSGGSNGGDEPTDNPDSGCEGSSCPTNPNEENSREHPDDFEGRGGRGRGDGGSGLPDINVIGGRRPTPAPRIEGPAFDPGIIDPPSPLVQ